MATRTITLGVPDFTLDTDGTLAANADDRVATQKATRTYVDALDALDVGADPAGTAAGLVDDLSGVSNAAAARVNLGLGSAAVTDTGTGAGNTVLGNDSRLTDARTPTAHTHAMSDVLGLDDALEEAAAGGGPGGALYLWSTTR